MKRAGKIHINQRGFSMIEMVMVLIVMAIMASFIMSRATTGNDLIAQTEILKSHLRYAQIKAMNDTDVTVPGGWGIHLPNNSSYTLYRNNAIADNTLYGDILPGETAQTHNLPSGVTVSTDCVNSTCNFNEWGSPGATTLTMTLTQGTSTSIIISITKNTGFVN